MRDQMIRVLALGGRARLVVADTTGVVDVLRGIHSTSPVVTAALGRVATGALLLAAMLEKLTEREPVLTLEVEGDGPAGKILATASPAGWVRGFARHPQAAAPMRPDGKLGVGAVVGREGVLSVARDLGYGQPYRGTVPLVNGEIASDLTFYLSDSEQTPAAVGLGVFVLDGGAVGAAGGFLLQLLPGVAEHEAESLADRIRGFGEVTEHLRQGRSPLDWLHTLFPGDFEVVSSTTVEFHCGCSIQKVERSLKLLGRTELGDLIAATTGPSAAVHCQFCGKDYSILTADLVRLSEELEQEAAAGEGSAERLSLE